jgi:hypothetical protein
MIDVFQTKHDNNNVDLDDEEKLCSLYYAFGSLYPSHLLPVQSFTSDLFLKIILGYIIVNSICLQRLDEFLEDKKQEKDNLLSSTEIWYNFTPVSQHQKYFDFSLVHQYKEETNFEKYCRLYSELCNMNTLLV